MELVDRFGGKIDYIRVSVTDRCNLRCLYCMPNVPFSWTPKEEILSFEDMFEFIKNFYRWMVLKKIRINWRRAFVRKEFG